jgi:hypothetical protein
MCNEELRDLGFGAHLDQKLDQIQVTLFLGRPLEVHDGQSKERLAVSRVDRTSVFLESNKIAPFDDFSETRRPGVAGFVFLVRVKLTPPLVNARRTHSGQAIRFLAALAEGG